MSEQKNDAARGALLMTAAKGFFVIGGLAVQLGLPRLLRSPAEYGLYATATALLAIFTNTLTQGVRADHEQAHERERRARAPRACAVR